MNLPLEILVLLSSVGALQSLFFAIYLLTLNKGNRLANRLLAWLLLALTARVAKSAGYYFTNDHLPTIVQNLGFAANTAIAPLLYLYLRAFFSNETKFKTRGWLHFIPLFAIVLLNPLIQDVFWLQQDGYPLVLHHMFAYVLWSGYILYHYLVKNNRLPKNQTRQTVQLWTLSLWGGIALIWAAYASNFFMGWVPYITAPVIFSVFMYLVGFVGLKRNQVFFDANLCQPAKETRNKYKHSGLTPEEATRYLAKLKTLMSETQPYLSPEITLPKLAKNVPMPAYLLSQLINEQLGQNFSDFINSYRIAEACRKLLAPEGQKQKISGIAYDCGFNTLSAFNIAFKKQTQTTPSQYRKNNLSAARKTSS